MKVTFNDTLITVVRCFEGIVNKSIYSDGTERTGNARSA
jgi:hypothetical protein